MERYRYMKLLILAILYIENARGTEDFPSLISANASLAIVLDREYLGEQYSPALESIKEYMKELAREQLKHGGVNVHYYSWSTITLKSEITAVLSVASCQDTWRLYKTARAERVALLAVTDADCPRLPRGGAISIPLLEPGQELPQIALDMRAYKAFDWKAAVVIHDDTLSRDMISRMVTAMTVQVDDKTISSVAISVFKMKHEENELNRRQEIDKTFSKLKPKYSGENYFVIVTTDVMASVMEVAKMRNMVHPKAQWLYFISDTDKQHDNITSFAEVMGEGENIAIVYNITVDDPSCQRGLVCQCKELLRGFVLALDKAIVDEMEVASQVSDEEWEAIRPTKEERGVSLVSQIESYLSAYSVCNNCSYWRLRSADTWGTSFQRRNLNSNKIDLLQVGFWRSVDGLSLADRMFPHIAHGFRGRKLPIITMNNPPWTILSVNETGAIIKHTGLVFDIMNELAKNLNFSYYMIFPGSGRDDMVNDTFEGHYETDSMSYRVLSEDDIFRSIERKSVLLAASAFTVTQDLKDRVNFTMPISVQPYTFLVSRPKELGRALLFMAPFATDTWFCLGFSLILMGPALYVVHRLSPFYEYVKNNKRSGLATLHHCFWYMYGALLQQGGMYLPEADSGRLMVGTWWLVVLVVVTTYCGNLVAFLTFPRQEAPITNVYELLHHEPALTWSLRRGTYLEDCLKDTEQGIYKYMYSQAILNYGETSQSIERVREGKHAIIDWKINLQFIMKREFLTTDRCDYALSSEEFFEEQMAMIMPKNNPYLTMINDEIKRMHQVGLIQKWLTQYLPKRDRCWNIGKVAEVNNHTVNLDDMQGCFFVLFLGFFTACLILIGEKLLNWRRVRIEKAAVKPFTN